MIKKLFISLFFISICAYGQDRISTMTLDNLATHIVNSHVSLYFDNTNSELLKKNQVSVTYYSRTNKGKDVEKEILMNKIDFTEIEKLIMNLKFSDFIQQNHKIILDGYNTKLTINTTFENSNSIILESNNAKSNNFKPIIDLILKKLNLKEKDFYK
jgi:hypothetical protein